MTDFDMDEISLVMNKVPVYSSTSIEVRANEEAEVETRAICLEASYTELLTEEHKKPKYDNSAYKERIANLKTGGRTKV